MATTNDASGYVKWAVGMAEGDVENHRPPGITLRVTERDGAHPMVTQDYRRDRLNLRIRDGRVFEAYVG